MKLAEIAEALSAELSGAPDLEVDRLVHPADAEDGGDLAIALSGEAAAALAGCRAGAAVIGAKAAIGDAGMPVIRYGGDERGAIAILTALFDPGPAHAEGVAPTAIVADDAELGDNVHIGAHAVIGPKSRIGAGTVVLANVTIGAGVAIGRDCVLHPGVAVADNVTIGDRVIVHANTVIGADGFSFIPARLAGEAMPRRIHSVGSVEIGDDVEIGAGTTIDRATLRRTRIGRGTKIDNQVQIAHNAVIGEGCLICGMVGIAGSVKIGDRVLIGAGAGIRDHVTIGDDATIAAKAGVGGNVAGGTVVSGSPAVSHEKSVERYANVGRLPSLYRRVGTLAERVDALEKVSEGLGQQEQAESIGGSNGRRG